MNNQLIIELDKCFECGGLKDDMHHVIPKSKGGTKTIPLCAKCHGLIHDKDFVRHRRLLLEGVKRAKELGKYAGRKKGAIQTNQDVLNKHNDVVELLTQNNSIRSIVEITKKSSTTIQKVRHILDDLGLMKTK